jgi:predicted transcriptional regulator of viral defense system
MAEMLALTGGKSGTVVARLSELTSLGWVERVGRGEYRITTLGAKAFLDEIAPKLKPREDA